MDLSIIIPVYNSEKSLRACILSILNSDFGGSFEIIVVDDGSTDNSIEKIKDLDVKVIRQENKGAAASRNLGARLAGADLLIFVDSDIVFFKDTLKRTYEHLKKDDIDYVTGRYSRKSINQKWIHKYKALADYSYYYDFIFTKEQKQRPIKQAVVTGCVGIKKKVFRDLGGFDERIKGADIENERLIAKLLQNYNILTDVNIKIRHYFPDFTKLMKNYFTRTLHLMNTAHKDNYYAQSHLKKNVFRCALGALTTVSLFFSLALFPIFGSPLPFIVSLILFSAYLAAHLSMFVLAFKEYGFLFMLYTLVINLFFCFLISMAGFLGIVKNLLRI